MRTAHRWDLMESFVHVVGAGSFSAAATRLDVSKSLLSKKVAQLEKELGTQLLVRTTRRLNPTDAGQALYQKFERLILDLEEVQQSVSNLHVEPRGQLRVVCTDILGEQYITRAAAEICSAHPKLRVDVHVTMRMVDLVAEGYDLAVRYGTLNDSSLKARKVFSLPHVVCASPAYLRARGVPREIEDLRRHNCIVATFEPCATWLFNVNGKETPIDLQGNWRSNSGAALVTAAVEGVGICRLPELYVRDYLRRGRLVPLLEEYRSEPLPVWMVYPNARYTPATVKLFIDYFVQHVERLTSDVGTPRSARALSG